ncbi:hypothetical protein EJB05_44682 [Eragrostis curvula]|uniref:Caffeoyl-CoA O-methyltransferase n=1 Tax=Eragrostis curvula TaxID=38414 RepID=A0A5J9TIU2_9POAL|nr:hypothetical protein EJB05_44682 [Eragrostis curvula]
MATGGGGVPSNTVSSSKTLLKSQALYKYVLDTTVLPNEPECMRELRLLTEKHNRAVMATPPDEAPLLRMLIKLTGARNSIEGGVFTGYSLLATALALPDDGRVVAIDTNPEYYELGRPFLEKAGVAGKVDFRAGRALDRLDELLARRGQQQPGPVRLRPSYAAYHERLLRLVRVGGVIVYDNTLWDGTVALPPDAPQLSDFDRRISAAIRDLNARLAADGRVEVCQLTIADGVTICRRIV